MRYEKPTLKLGIAPTRRDLWNNKETNDNYQKILERTKEIAKESGIELVTLEELDFSAKRFTLGGRTIEMPADQYLTDYEDACVAAEYFKEKGVQALFLPFCNFGQEEAAAKLASELKVPVLLWGPRDQKPDVMQILGISRSAAYKLMRQINSELEKKGYIVIRGKVSRKYFEERIYGMSDAG